MEVASDLRATHGLRTPEAIHLATALHRRADAFVTEDRRHFPNHVEGVPGLSLLEALDRRASRASREAFEAALAQLPDVEPEEQDRL